MAKKRYLSKITFPEFGITQVILDGSDSPEEPITEIMEIDYDKMKAYNATGWMNNQIEKIQGNIEKYKKIPYLDISWHYRKITDTQEREPFPIEPIFKDKKISGTIHFLDLDVAYSGSSHASRARVEFEGIIMPLDVSDLNQILKDGGFPYTGDFQFFVKGAEIKLGLAEED